MKSYYSFLLKQLLQHPSKIDSYASCMNNNFIMTSTEPSPEQTNKKTTGPTTAKAEDEKIIDYDHENSEFMRPLVQPKQRELESKLMPKVNKSVVLSPQEVEKSLKQIYHFYAHAYERPVKQYTSFAQIPSEKMIMQAYFLFCKSFHILKAIFSVERLTIIFKKHADFGKYLSFDNFHFLINSMSHEQESKDFFHLEPMIKNLDIETAEQLERQQLYNYLQLGSADKYRQNFSELFLPFNMKQKPNFIKKDYNYRKFSLPELRKKALPEPKEKLKGEKDLFILKHDKNLQHNQFDQAKSIVVSWDSLRAKSVSNLPKSQQMVEKKYLKDPEKDPFLEQVRPNSKHSPKAAHHKLSRLLQGGKLDKKIKQIEQVQQLKNRKILERIEQKLKVKSGRKLQL